MSSVALGTKQSSSPEAVAAFGPDAVVFQRLILNVAADTYGDPITLTLEILGTETLPPTFVAGVLSAGTIAAPVNLGSVLQLSLDPFNAPFAIAMTDFGAVKQIAGSPPKLTLSAQTPRVFSGRIGRRDPPQPAGARVRGDRLAGFMGGEARRDDLRDQDPQVGRGRSPRDLPAERRRRPAR